MNFDKRKINAALPPFFRDLLEELYSHGFIPTLVGGAVRDFFLKDKLGHDWDVELTHDTISFNKGQWKELGKGLSSLGKVTYLPYEVIRLEVDSFQMEFSPPRIEKFLDGKHHHSNFEAEFDFKLPFEKAILRRDFTINAMGVRFRSGKEMEFLDPSEGLKHLNERTLQAVGPNFSKDPVRFLRAHRFAQKLGFKFTSELENILEQMKVEGVTSTYLWSEMQKSGDPLSYLGRLMKARTKHPEMKLPLDDSFLGKLSELKKILIDPKRHETWLVALEWVDIPGSGWQEYFSLSSDTCRRLSRWSRSSKFFQKHLPEEFHGEFESLRDTEDFEILFDWYFTTKQLLQKNPDLPLLKMIEDTLPDWIHLYRFQAPQDVKHIDPPYRAKYQVWNLCQRL